MQEPLRKIRAFGDRPQSKHAEALGDSGRDYLERMQGAAGRMQTLIQDLLAFSRIASKPQPFQEVDLVNLPVLRADPLQMRQLLQNLIGNALKFHRPGSPPVVEVRGVPLPEAHGWSGDAPLAQLVVRDDGIGFDEKYLDRIFAPFQRLHGRTEYEGTGMGLAICRKITERHGGTLTARSTAGQGSTFIVTLPIHHAEPAYA